MWWQLIINGNIEILVRGLLSLYFYGWEVQRIFYPAGWRMVVLAMQYSDTRYGGTHSACAARINIEAPCSGGWWWWWQLHQPRSSNKLSTLIIIILNPPASSWQWWSLGFKKGVKEVNASLNYSYRIDGSDSLRFSSASDYYSILYFCSTIYQQHITAK